MKRSLLTALAALPLVAGPATPANAYTYTYGKPSGRLFEAIVAHEVGHCLGWFNHCVPASTSIMRAVLDRLGSRPWRTRTSYFLQRPYIYRYTAIYNLCEYATQHHSLSTNFSKSLARISRATLHIFVAAVVTVTSAGWGMAAQGASAASTEPPMGLMIQVSSLAQSISPTQLKAMLERVRTKHRVNAASTGYVNNLVLQDIAGPDGKILTSYLDVIKPYMPGGITPAFTSAYVGTVDLAWAGSGSKYIEGIASPSFRGQNVTLSNTVAKAYSQRYSTLNYNWYITYEANLGAFWNDDVKNNYTTYINQLAASLSTVKSGRTFMWSPAFWTEYSEMPAWALPSLQINMKDAASKITVPFILNLQDFVGQSNGASTRGDAVVWMNYLKTNWKSPKTTTYQINVEQFAQSSTGAITVGNATEIIAREKYYVQQGLTLGPAFEIRFWHQRLYGAYAAQIQRLHHYNDNV